MNDGFIVVCAFLIAAAAAFVGATYVGATYVDREIAFDCQNYGKTRIEGKWYACEPMEESK